MYKLVKLLLTYSRTLLQPFISTYFQQGDNGVCDYEQGLWRQIA
jgi:hypothetical protein